MDAWFFAPNTWVKRATIDASGGITCASLTAGSTLANACRVGIKQTADSYDGGLRLEMAGSSNNWSIVIGSDTNLYLAYNNAAVTPAFVLMSNGGIALGSRTTLMPSNYGYSPTYKTVQLGTFDNTGTTALTVAIGVSPSAVVGASFQGDGSEILLSRNMRLLQPNIAGTDWEFASINAGVCTFLTVAANSFGSAQYLNPTGVSGVIHTSSIESDYYVNGTIRLILGSTGASVIGALAVSGKGSFIGTGASYAEGQEALIAGTATKFLEMGFNTTGDKGYIQAVHTATAWKDLHLNPNGGDVHCGAGLTAAGVVQAYQQFRVTNFMTPGLSTAAGVVGSFVYDENYIYVCTATNTWKRAALATW